MNNTLNNDKPATKIHNDELINSMFDPIFNLSSKIQILENYCR